MAISVVSSWEGHCSSKTFVVFAGRLEASEGGLPAYHLVYFCISMITLYDIIHMLKLIFGISKYQPMVFDQLNIQLFSNGFPWKCFWLVQKTWPYVWGGRETNPDPTFGVAGRQPGSVWHEGCHLSFLLKNFDFGAKLDERECLLPTYTCHFYDVWCEWISRKEHFIENHNINLLYSTTIWFSSWCPISSLVR